MRSETSRWPEITRELQRKYLARLWRHFGGKHGCISEIGKFLGISRQHALILLAFHGFRKMKRRGPYRSRYEAKPKKSRPAPPVQAAVQQHPVRAVSAPRRDYFGVRVSP